jgi:CBS domain containing-hemolysin-like protein
MNYLSGLITNGNHGDRINKAELYNYIRIGYDQGVIDPEEFKIIENLLKLRNIRIRDIMTPRTVVESIEPGLKVNDLKEKIMNLHFSRIPLYNSKKNRIHGFVLRREVMDYINKNKLGKSLNSISSKPVFLPDSLSILELMNFFAEKGIHMVFVINEYGDYTGLVTIEDAIETLLGIEIVDEYDQVTDMQALAYKKMALNLKGKKNRPDK